MESWDEVEGATEAFRGLGLDTSDKMDTWRRAITNALMTGNFDEMREYAVDVGDEDLINSIDQRVGNTRERHVDAMGKPFSGPGSAPGDLGPLHRDYKKQ